MIVITLENIKLSRDHEVAPAYQVLTGDIKFSKEGSEDQYLRQIAVIEFVEAIYTLARDMAFLGIPKRDFDVGFMSTAGFHMNFEKAVTPNCWILKIFKPQTTGKPVIVQFESSFLELIPSFQSCVTTIASEIENHKIDMGSKHLFHNLRLKYIYTYPHTEAVYPTPDEQGTNDIFGIAKALNKD